MIGQIAFIIASMCNARRLMPSSHKFDCAQFFGHFVKEIANLQYAQSSYVLSTREFLRSLQKESVPRASLLALLLSSYKLLCAFMTQQCTRVHLRFLVKTCFTVSALS